MLGSFSSFRVKGNKIRVRCPHCKKVRYYAIPLNLRKKIVRCHCGKSMHCILDYRTIRRESSAGEVEVVMDTRTFRAQISDVSGAGVGFNVKGPTKSFKIGQNLIIRFKRFNSIRKIRISNVSSSRIGAQYTDIRPF